MGDPRPICKIVAAVAIGAHWGKATATLIQSVPEILYVDSIIVDQSFFGVVLIAALPQVSIKGSKKDTWNVYI